MKRKCPACGGAISEDANQFCPSCEKLQLQLNKLSGEELGQLSKIVVSQLRADLKFILVVSGVVLAVVLLVIGAIDAIVGFNVYDKMSRHFTTLENQVTNRISESLTALNEKVLKSLAEVDIQTRSNIARKFDEPVLEGIIQDVAKREAKNILENEVQRAVDSFQADAQLVRTVARAQAYDFKAYQQLLQIGNNTNENAEFANRVLDQIDRTLERDRSPIFPTTRFRTASGTNFYDGPFTSDELARIFKRISDDKTVLNREGFINTISTLNQPLFLPLLIQFFTNEADLGVADKVAISISSLTKQEFRPRDFERLIAWWEDNHLSYKSWPFFAHELAMRELGSGEFSKAAEAFEVVLEIDPSADMSRAFAIACYLETGDTNRASTLANGFKDNSGRWAEWAAVKAELDSGSISNATVRLSKLMSHFPGISIQKDYWFRKADWQLLNSVAGTNSP